MSTLRWRSVCLTAIGLGVLIHVDWHLGRTHDDHLSFGLAYHWLLGVVTFAALPWFFSRRESAVIVLLGVLLGQGLEPLIEILFLDPGSRPFADGLRWRVFAEFMASGLIAFGLSATWQARHAAATVAQTGSPE